MTRVRISLQLIAVGLGISWLFRGLLFFTYRDYFGGLEAGQVSMAFLYGLQFDLAMVLGLLFFPLWLMNLPSHRADHARWVNIWRTTGYLALIGYAFLLLGDLLYFEHVKRHIGRELYMMGEDFALIGDLATGQYLWPVLIGLGATVLGLLAAYKTRPATIAPTNRVARITFFACLPFIVTIAIRGGISEGRPMSTVNAFEHGDYRMGNLVLNGAYSALRSDSEGNVERLQPGADVFDSATNRWGYYDASDQHPFAQQLVHPQFEDKNVVLVLLESWSFKYIDSLSGSEHGVTPNLDKLVEKSLVFPRSYAVAQRSITGMQGILASIPPLPGLPVLGEGLETNHLGGIGHLALEQGYQTLFVQSASRQSFHMESIARALGYQHYYGMEDMELQLDYPGGEFARFGWDYETFMLFRDKLDALTREPSSPFLATVYSGSTHVPYPELPERFYRYPHNDHSESGFLNMLNYSDWALGEFMGWAQQQAWFGDTVFIITADHPLGAYAMGKQRHEALDDALRVPLVLYAPETLEAGSNPVIASQLDILPTVADLIGYRKPFSATGTSLLRKRDSFALGTEGEILVAIDDEGYLYHSLKRRLDSSLNDTQPSASYLDELEKHLLFLDYSVYQALDNNQWLPPAELTRVGSAAATAQ